MQQTVDKITKTLGVVALILVTLGVYYNLFQVLAPKFNKSAFIIEADLISSKDIALALEDKLQGAPVEFAGGADAMYFAPAPKDVWELIHDISPDMPYTSEVYDCDDFASRFKAELARKWAGRGERLPLPIITVWAHVQFRNGEEGGHAFNGLVMSSGKVIWIEPQGPAIYRTLKILEVYSVTF